MNTPVSDVNSAMKQLAGSLMQKLDTNKDKQLSSDEFSQFLTLLTSSVGSTPLSGITPSGSAGAAAAGPACVFEGFDFMRPQNTEKSCKDAFASLAMKAGYMPTTKSGAEEWFNTNIKAGLSNLGHRVDWVQGDKFQFSNWQGTWVVDFVRGADGPNPALAWGAEPA